MRARSPATRRLYRLTLSGAAATAAVALAGCGVAGRGTGTHVRPVASTRTHRDPAAYNRQAAQREAQALLREGVVPVGAVPLSSEPAGDGGALAHPAQEPGLADLIDLHRWWRVAGSENVVYRFIKAHRPRGARLNGWGRRYPRPTAAFVDFEFGPVSGTFESRGLNIVIAPLGQHAVGVRVDSQVVWTFPRPASEHLPSGVRTIRVVRERLGRLPLAAVTVTSPAAVRRLVALFNGLSIDQPGAVWNCPVQRPQPTIIFSFRTSPAGSPMATATYTGTCGGSSFKIHGRPQHPLDNVYAAVQATQRLTGLKLIPQEPQ